MQRLFTYEAQDLKDYLTSSEIIDYDIENIKEIAESISKDIKDEVELARKVYE